MTPTRFRRCCPGNRAAKAAAAKEAAQKAAAEEAERQRQAAMIQQDKDKGAKMASDLKNGYENLRAGGGVTAHQVWISHTSSQRPKNTGAMLLSACPVMPIVTLFISLSVSLFQDDDPSKMVYWRVIPSAPVAGTKAKLQYNRMAGPLRMDIPADKAG